MLRIRLLGAFQLTYHGSSVTVVHTTRLQSLLAYLVLHAGEPLSRQHLAFLFWPDSTESQSRTNLRKALFDLRHALPDADDFLLMGRGTVQWSDNSAYLLDVADLIGLLDQYDNGIFGRDSLMAIVEHYRGELLLGCYDEWIIALRDRLHRRVQAALATLVRQLEVGREYAASIDYAQRLLDMDPLDEATYQHLMRLHALLGDRSSALRVYHACVRVLQRELDVEPDEATQEIYSRILNRTAQPKQPVIQDAAQLHDTVGMVGREAEWKTLRSAWQQTLRGRAQFVAICGEAGIGKTRLAEEMLAWVDRQGYLTAQARSHEAQGSLAYAPVAECLRTFNRHRPLNQLDDIWQTELSRLLPDLVVQRPDLPKPQPMSEGWQRLHLFQALSLALGEDGEPLLLLFDDLQWCDQESLEWLHFFVERRRDQPLLVLATVRDTELDVGHPYLKFQAALRRSGQTMTLPLAPLDEAQTFALAAKLEMADLSETQATELFIHTEGNPLFVIETVRAGVDNGDGASEEGNAVGLPPKVYALIESRLSRLSPQAFEIASLVAAAGTTCSYRILTEAARQDEDTLVDSLDELWRRRIILERGKGYDFSHDRLRDVAYAELSNARKRLLHRRIAHGLFTAHADSLETVYSQLAEQHTRAGANEDAVRYYRLAGDHARTLYALGEALGHYQRASALSEMGKGYDEVIALSAQIHLELYQGEDAVQAFRWLLDNVELQDDPVRKIKFLLGLGWAHYIVAMDQPASDAVRSSWDAYEQAYQTAKEHDDWQRMVRARVGIRYHVMFSIDYYVEAQRNIDEALSLSRSGGDEKLWLNSWLAAFHHRNPDEWAREGERLAAKLPPDLDRSRLTELNFLLQVSHGVRGDFKRSVAYGNACIDLANSSGVPPVQYPAYKALALLHQGCYHEAWQSLQQEITDEDHPFGSVFKSFVTALYLLDLLACSDAATMLARVIERANSLHRPWLVDLATVHLGRALALGGQTDDETLGAISQTISDMSTMLLARIVGLPAVALGEIALAMGEPEAALDRLVETMDVAEQEGRRPDAAMAGEVRARILLRLDRAEEALDVADDTLALAESMDCLPTVWRIHESRSQALQALGKRADAGEAICCCSGIIGKIAEALPVPEQRAEFLSNQRVMAINDLAQERANGGSNADEAE